MVIKLHNNPTVFSDTEPSPSDFTHGPWLGEDWMWYNTNNHRWYEYVGGQWVIQGSEPVVGLDLDTTDEIKKITRLKIEGGIITAFEYEV